MKNQLDLSIIIVNYNTEDQLKKCLSSILENVSQDIKFEIIVVDNYSKDNSVEVAQKFPGVKVIKNEKNLGFAKANNQGLKLAKGENVCFLNPDTIVHYNAFEILINYIKNNPRVGAVGPMLLGKDGSLQCSAYSLPSIGSLFYRFFNLRPTVKTLNNIVFKAIKKKIVPLSTEQSYDKPFPSGWILGACILMPRQLALNLKGFDEDYFLYWEEIDLCKRITKRNFEIHVVPEARVTHLIGQSVAKAKEFSLLQWFKNLSIYYKKNFPYLSNLLARVILSVSILLHIIFDGKNLKYNFLNRRMAFNILKIIWKS